MKKNILFFYFSFIGVHIFAQNIVYNSSFELYSVCPSASIYDIDSVTGWNSYKETPDYFNSCANPASQPSVPISVCGYQQAASGNAYIAIFSYGSQGSDTTFREYVGAQLSTMLSIGQKYYVSFKVNLTDNHINCATNNLGIVFSTVSYSYSYPAPIRNFAHVNTVAIITDTANWTIISGSFTSDSSYKYIIIGNFFDNPHTSFTRLNNSLPCSSYYFVDDICVSVDSFTCNAPTTINENKNAMENISVFPNPTSGNATIKYTLPQGENQGEIIIYDIAGAEVKRVAVNSGSNQVVLDNAVLQAGTYFYQLITSKGVVGTKKMVVMK